MKGEAIYRTYCEEARRGQPMMLPLEWPDLSPQAKRAWDRTAARFTDGSSNEDIERWYAAFEKVTGMEAKTIEGRRSIFKEFAAEYVRLVDGAQATPQPADTALADRACTSCHHSIWEHADDVGCRVSGCDCRAWTP